jgi:hypothetical protein
MPNMKPILFNTPMVQAILQNRKTTTRRPVKNLAISDNGNGYFTAKEIHKGEITEYLDETFGGPYDFVIANAVEYAPYQKGDILYVRETFIKSDDGYCYKADIKVPSESEDLRKAYGYKWKPSIHMPKEAARIFLRVTGVTAERLQDITEEQAKKEGFKSNGISIVGARCEFVELWNSTIKKQDLDKYGLEANPWVWVIEFERCEKP